MLDHTHRLCSLCRWCAAGCSPCPRGSAPVRAGTAPASSARSAGASGWTTRSTTCCSPWVPVCADKRAALVDGAPPLMMGVTDADDGMKPALRSARRSRPWETLVERHQRVTITTALSKSTHNPRRLLWGRFMCAYESVGYSIPTRRSYIASSRSAVSVSPSSVSHTYRHRTRNSFRFSAWRHSERYILYLPGRDCGSTFFYRPVSYLHTLYLL